MMIAPLSLMQILTVASTALVTSTITSLIGAGGGTVLLLVMLYVLPAPSVIPIHGCIQIISNSTRVYLFWRHMHWPIIFRFITLMPIGVYLGLQLYHLLEPHMIKLVIAIAILVSLFMRMPRAAGEAKFPPALYYPLGLFIGFGNMIVGVLSPVLAAVLRLEALSKEQTVATLGFFGFMGNILKIAGFSAVGFAFVHYLPLIVPACIASIIGGYAGKFLLQRSSNQFFQQAFKGMIAVLALKMIWDVFSG